MTSFKPSEDTVVGLIENEKLLRKSNERTQKRIKRDFSQKERVKTTIHFYCECSNIPCVMRIKLTESEYEAIHHERDKFIIAKGHEVPGIEKIIAEHDDFYVIEKHALNP